MSALSRAALRLLAAGASVLSLVPSPLALAQPGAPPPAPPSFRVLADQIAALFPTVHTEVVEMAGSRVTLAGGRARGLVPGLELVVVREGRELHHPTTRELLGRMEEALGRVVVVEVFEQYAVAALLSGGAGIQPGDKARVPAGKVRLAVV